MKTFTRSDVLSWRPCHGAAGTRRIMRGLPRKMTALDVLRHEAATPADRLWCVLRSDVLSERTMRLFAAWCARTALDAGRAAGREPDPRSCAAVEIAERYALGNADDRELRAAYAAACAAYAACAAAYACAAACAYAAYADDADAADAAARALVCHSRAVAPGAADARAACAACAAARSAQVARLIQIIEEGEK